MLSKSVDTNDSSSFAIYSSTCIIASHLDSCFEIPFQLNERLIYAVASSSHLNNMLCNVSYIKLDYDQSLLILAKRKVPREQYLEKSKIHDLRYTIGQGTKFCS